MIYFTSDMWFMVGVGVTIIALAIILTVLDAIRKAKEE